MKDKKLIQFKEFKDKINKLPFEDNMPISLEFIDNSYYEQEMMHKTDNAYKKGFNNGVKDRLKNKERVSKTTMSGMINDLNSVYPKLLELKKDLFYSGYSLDDAPFHGWSGESLQNLHSIIDKQENMIDECISICQIALGLEIDKDAWDKI